MQVKEFCKQAIKNGHGQGAICEGWDWIRENIAELDAIFQTEEYKEQKGYKYKCMPILIGELELTEQEKDALGTAWFCNNERVSKQEKENRIKEFNKQGFYTIDKPTKEMHGKKIEFILDTTGELVLGGINTFKGRLFWSETDNLLMAMKSRSKRKGWWITPKVYIKFIK